MDIKAIIPTIPTAPAPKPAPEAKPPQAAERTLQGVSGASAQASDAAAEGPHIVHTHAELSFDETINRVVGRIVNEQTGETVHEMPPEQLKALYTKMREALGSLIDGTA